MLNKIEIKISKKSSCFIHSTSNLILCDRQGVLVHNKCDRKMKTNKHQNNPNQASHRASKPKG